MITQGRCNACGPYDFLVPLFANTTIVFSEDENNNIGGGRMFRHRNLQQGAASAIVLGSNVVDVEIDFDGFVRRLDLDGRIAAGQQQCQYGDQ